MDANITFVCHKDTVFPVNFSNIINVNVTISHYPVEPTLLSCSDILILQYLTRNNNYLSEINEIRNRYRYKPVIIISECFDSKVISWAASQNISNMVVFPDEHEHLVSVISLLIKENLGENSIKQSRYTDESNHKQHAEFSKSRDKCKTGKAMMYIRDNFNNKVQERTLASMCHMSVSTFTRTFKIEHGVTFSEYVQSYRLCVARKLLRNTMLPISEIANMCGFSDAAYFTKLFKKMENITPKVFRGLYQCKMCDLSH